MQLHPSLSNPAGAPITHYEAQHLIVFENQPDLCITQGKGSQSCGADGGDGASRAAAAAHVHASSGEKNSVATSSIGGVETSSVAVNASLVHRDGIIACCANDVAAQPISHKTVARGGDEMDIAPNTTAAHQDCTPAERGTTLVMARTETADSTPRPVPAGEASVPEPGLGLREPVTNEQGSQTWVVERTESLLPYFTARDLPTYCRCDTQEPPRFSAVCTIWRCMSTEGPLPHSVSSTAASKWKGSPNVVNFFVFCMNQQSPKRFETFLSVSPADKLS